MKELNSLERVLFYLNIRGNFSLKFYPFVYCMLLLFQLIDPKPQHPLEKNVKKISDPKNVRKASSVPNQRVIVPDDGNA